MRGMKKVDEVSPHISYSQRLFRPAKSERAVCNREGAGNAGYKQNRCGFAHHAYPVESGKPILVAAHG